METVTEMKNPASIVSPEPTQISFVGRVFLRVSVAITLLYFFLVGVKILSSGIKVLGGGYAKTLFDLTHNPAVGLFSGILATTLFQSSSVTTSIIVGMVSGGALSVAGAVPMIMGANIGTSVTNTLVSLGHIRNRMEFRRAFAAASVHDFFNLLGVVVFLPLELMTGFLSRSSTVLAGALFGSASGMKFDSPIKVAIQPVAHALQTAASGFGDLSGVVLILMAFILIISTLVMLVRNMKPLVESEAAEGIKRIIGHPVLAILLGIGLTIAVQSSSITTSLLVPMAGSGLLSLQAVYPVTIGANIGTTTTAMLAALTGNASGLTIAFVHLLFNVCGLLLFFVFKPLRPLAPFLAEKLSSLVAINRMYAIAYVALVFFILPFGLVLFLR